MASGCAAAHGDLALFPAYGELWPDGGAVRESCHAKNRLALSLKPFWRNTITLNDEPENLLILPPIDDSIEDKIILLRAKKARLPADIGTAAGRKNYTNFSLRLHYSVDAGKEGHAEAIPPEPA